MHGLPRLTNQIHHQRDYPQYRLKRIHHRDQAPEHITDDLPTLHVIEAAGFIDGRE